jgi:hypothetical protein
VLDPERNGNGADPVALAAEVRNHPAPLTFLKVRHLKRRKLTLAKSTAN